MLKKTVIVIWALIYMFYFRLCFAQTESVVIMGSVIDAKDEAPIPHASLIFQIDTLRFHQQLTDELGFFMINLPRINEAKIFKYNIQHEKYLPEKGAYVIQAVNDPLTIGLQRDPSNELKQMLKIEGCIKSEDDELPVVGADLHFRIGEVILPDTSTDENGCFVIPLTPDDLGKVLTYRILKTGFSPRYGYTSIEKDNEPIEIRMQKWVYTVSGYVKDARKGKPLVAARVTLDLESEKPIVKLTSRWGFFTHTFTKLIAGHKITFRVENYEYHPYEIQLEPKNDQETQLEIKLEPLRTKPPIYKNRIFWFATAGVAAITTSILLIVGGDEKEPEPNDLPYPPIPPDN